MPRWPRTPLTDAQRDALAPHVGVAYAVAGRAVRGRLLPTRVYDAAFDAAEDEAIRAARRYRPGAGRSLPSYVGYRVARQLPRAMWRAWRWRWRATAPLKTALGTPAPGDPFAATDAADEWEGVRGRMATLTPRERSVLERLHGIDGLPPAASLREAGEQLGITQTPAYMARERAYAKLRDAPGCRHAAG